LHLRANSIENTLNTMSLAEKIGQLFMIGFKGTTITEEIKEMIKKYHVGNIIYFNRNIESSEQLSNLSSKLQKIAANSDTGLPLIISTDQEGGTVTRLKGGTHFPGQMAVGATRDVNLAQKMSSAIASELKAVGINMNLSPVLDVNNNPNNPVIGVRSFGEDPEMVAELGSVYINAMQDEGVISCGKHFPGHGDTNIDSHLSLPVIKHRRERLEEVELYPFEEAIKNNIDSIMTAHIYFPAFEKRKIPATISKNVLTGLLRNEMKFEGVIITDCLEMKVIADTVGTARGAYKAIKAGSDIVLISHNIEKVKKAINIIINAVERGELSQERINKSVSRILKLKAERIAENSTTDSFINLHKAQKTGQRAANEVAEKSVTLVKDKEKVLPISKKARIFVCDFNMVRSSMVENKKIYKNLLPEYLKKEGIDVDYYTFNNREASLPDTSEYDLVVVCTYNAVDNREQIEIIQELKEITDEILALSIRNPYDLKLLKDINVLATYVGGKEIFSNFH